MRATSYQGGFRPRGAAGRGERMSPPAWATMQGDTHSPDGPTLADVPPEEAFSQGAGVAPDAAQDTPSAPIAAAPVGLNYGEVPQRSLEPAPKRGFAGLIANPAFPGSFVFGVTLLLLIAHQGRIVQYAYPAMISIAAVMLYRRHPVHWVALMLWVIFLTPEVRRLSDYFNGAFNPGNPIMVAPFAFTGLGALGVVRYHRVLAQRRAMPLMLVVAGAVYGLGVGIVRVGPMPALFGFLIWGSPITIGFHMLIHWRHYAEFRRVISATFRYGSLVMGLYGVYEFVTMPPWDAFWLAGSQMSSEGNPVPFGIRVASTMNSSGAFAVAAMVCVLFLLADKGRVRAVAACGILLSLMFSSVRTAWGGLVIGLIFPFSLFNMRMRLRMIGSLLMLTVVAVPLMSIDQFSGPVLKRFQSIGNLSEDQSFNDRSRFYAQFLDTALTDIAGQGIGSTGAATKMDKSNTGGGYAVFDSGLMEIPFVLGWPGTLMFGGGVLWLAARAFACAMSIHKDRFAASSVGAALALLAMLISANMLTGLGGILFYMGVMLPVIGRRAIRHGLATQVERA